MPPLDEAHKVSRINYCNYILSFPSMPYIIFTDESTVVQNLHKKGIWRKRGCYPEGSFAITEKHPISVMVWGGIGPNGFKTDLLRCPERMTALTYANMLSENHTLFTIGQNIPDFIWQQDGAGPHKACFEIIEQLLGGRIVK